LPTLALERLDIRIDQEPCQTGKHLVRFPHLALNLALSQEVGRALRALHLMPPPAGLMVHNGAAEVRVLGRWTAWAEGYGMVDDALIAIRPAIERELTGAESPRCLVHRDFHDRQVILGAREELGSSTSTRSRSANRPSISAMRWRTWTSPPRADWHRRNASQVTPGRFLPGTRPSPQPSTAFRRTGARPGSRLECLHAFRPAT
jgi:hypothetical protein